MKRKLKFLSLLCFCCTFLLTSVYATGIGTLNVLATDPQEQPVAGFAVSVVFVADENGVLTDDFAGTSISSKDMTNMDAAAHNAEILYSYAESNGIDGTEILSDENGKGTFAGLECGIYLVKAGCGQELTFSPFLLFMPTSVNGEASWILEAQLKIGEPPEEPTEPEETTPQDPTPSLPQTGINKLPMYLLFVFGAVFIVMGIALMRSGKGRNQNE